jgi:hypothetical protein
MVFRPPRGAGTWVVSQGDGVKQRTVGSEAATVSTDQRGTKILARTFFSQLRAGGYTPNQIIAIATELIDLVASEIRESDRAHTHAEVAAPRKSSQPSV